MNQYKYFKLSLFVGFGEDSLINGLFKVTPNTKSIDNVAIGGQVITVDSTIGFSTSGILKVGDNTVTYVDKSVNQFLGCSGIENSINKTENLYLIDDTYYGYEDGDIKIYLYINI